MPAAPSIHVLAAVDRQRRAGHEPGIVGGEESHAPGDLLGMTEPADGYPRDDFLEYRLGNSGDHLGIDITWRDGVHGHAEACAFLRQGLGKSMDTALGGRIIDLAVLAGLSIDRADVDDAPPASLLHAREAGLGHVEASTEVDAKHLVPIVEAHLEQRPIARDAGVVDQDVNRSDLLLHPAASSQRRFVIADVPLVGGDAGLVAERSRLGLVTSEIRDHRHSVALEHLADCPADATCSTGYDCDACHILPHRVVAGPFVGRSAGAFEAKKNPAVA